MCDFVQRIIWLYQSPQNPSPLTICFLELNWVSLNLQHSSSCFVRKVQFLSGVRGNRTLVQTRKPYAFYMLIPALVFVMQQDPDHQLHPYPQRFSSRHRGMPWLFPIFRAPLYQNASEQELFERCLVLPPCDRIRPVNYCASFRQRERKYFRQLNLLITEIQEPATDAPHAYIPFQPAVKSC